MLEVTTIEELVKRVPAVAETTHTRSAKYQQVETVEVVKEFSNFGFNIKRGIGQGDQHGQHFVEMTHKNLMAPNGDYYSIVISNSHNGKTRLEVAFGYRRLVCDNGLAIHQSDIMPLRLKHIGNIKEEVATLVQTINSRVELLKETIDFWKNHTLTTKERTEFAKRVLQFKTRDAKIKNVNKDTIEEVLMTHRPEDEGITIWEVFNRVQENMIHGKFNYHYTVRDESGKFVTKSRKAKAMKRPTNIQQLNEVIWKLMADMVEDRRVEQSSILRALNDADSVAA